MHSGVDIFCKTPAYMLYTYNPGMVHHKAICMQCRLGVLLCMQLMWKAMQHNGFMLELSFSLS